MLRAGRPSAQDDRRAAYGVRARSGTPSTTAGDSGAAAAPHRSRRSEGRAMGPTLHERAEHALAVLAAVRGDVADRDASGAAAG